MFTRGTTCLLLCLLGILGLIQGEEEATIVAVDASKWPLNNVTKGGCGPENGTGCSPGYTVDGLYNDVESSRWGCHFWRVNPEGPCYIDFDLGIPFSLSYVLIYFFRSNDTTRGNVIFNISVSDDGEEFTDHITNAENTIPTPLGRGNAFPFEMSVTGRYVRMAGVNEDEQWMVVNEVRIFVNVVTPAPGGPGVSPAPSAQATVQPVEPSPAPGATPTPSAGATPGSTVEPTPADTDSGTPALSTSDSLPPETGAPVTGTFQQATVEEGDGAPNAAVVAWSLLGSILFCIVLVVGVFFRPTKMVNPASISETRPSGKQEGSVNS